MLRRKTVSVCSDPQEHDCSRRSPTKRWIRCSPKLKIVEVLDRVLEEVDHTATSIETSETRHYALSQTSLRRRGGYAAADSPEHFFEHFGECLSGEYLIEHLVEGGRPVVTIVRRGFRQGSRRSLVHRQETADVASQAPLRGSQRTRSRNRLLSRWRERLSERWRFR